MNKILNAHKSQMDIINDGFDRADFERKEKLENQLTATEQDSLEVMNEERHEAHEEKLRGKMIEDTHPDVHPDSPNQNIIGWEKE